MIRGRVLVAAPRSALLSAIASCDDRCCPGLQGSAAATHSLGRSVAVTPTAQSRIPQGSAHARLCVCRCIARCCLPAKHMYKRDPAYSAVIQRPCHPPHDTYPQYHVRRSFARLLPSSSSLLLLQHRPCLLCPLQHRNSHHHPRLRVHTPHLRGSYQPAAGSPPTTTKVHVEPCRRFASSATTNFCRPPTRRRAYAVQFQRIINHFQRLQLLFTERHSVSLRTQLLPVSTRITHGDDSIQHKHLLLQPLRQDGRLQRRLKHTKPTFDNPQQTTSTSPS